LSGGAAGKRISRNRLLLLCRELWDEIRAYGCWKVAEFEDDRVRLEIWLV
jgi:hypothetical protein